MKSCSDTNDLEEWIRSAHPRYNLQLLLHTHSTYRITDIVITQHHMIK